MLHLRYAMTHTAGKCWRDEQAGQNQKWVDANKAAGRAKWTAEKRWLIASTLSRDTSQKVGICHFWHFFLESVNLRFHKFITESGIIAKIGLLIGRITKIRFPISRCQDIGLSIGSITNVGLPIGSTTKIRFLIGSISKNVLQE